MVEGQEVSHEQGCLVTARASADLDDAVAAIIACLCEHQVEQRLCFEAELFLQLRDLHARELRELLVVAGGQRSVVL